MIRIVEVGPRDGLQNESKIIPTQTKIAFIDALAKAGLDEIEASAFVSPKWVPQLADAAEVFAGMQRDPGIVYSALAPNLQGAQRALAAGVDKIAVFTAASESFCQRNINTSIEGSLARFAPVLLEAKKKKLPTRGYVSTAFWCPYEGRVEPGAVLPVVHALLGAGVDEISIGDTLGTATREEVDALLNTLLPEVDASVLAMHFHDTYGRAVENVRLSFARGIQTFDASTGGLGGCPYAPGAAGNVATGAVVEALRLEGAEVRVDTQALAAAFQILKQGQKPGAL